MLIRFNQEVLVNIICVLTGVSEEYMLFQGDNASKRRLRFSEMLRNLCPLSQKMRHSREQWQVTIIYRHLHKGICFIAERVHVKQLSEQPWTSHTRQCANKRCSNKTGTMLPYHVGRGIVHLRLDHYRGSVFCIGDSASAAPQDTVESFKPSVNML